MTGAIPPGFCSRLEAIKRAEKTWGRRDALGKLKGLLVSGELIGWDGLSPPRVQKIGPEFWQKGSWGVLEGERTWLHRGRNPFLLFKQEDLDREYPELRDEAEAKPAAKDAAEAMESTQQPTTAPDRTLTHRRPVGKTPHQSRRIETEMRKMDRGELKDMIGKQMAEKFKAAISTCTACRDRVLLGKCRELARAYFPTFPEKRYISPYAKRA